MSLARPNMEVQMEENEVDHNCCRCCGTGCFELGTGVYLIGLFVRMRAWLYLIWFLIPPALHESNSPDTISFFKIFHNLYALIYYSINIAVTIPFAFYARSKYNYLNDSRDTL